MFREMRLKDQQLSREEAVAMLEKCTNGALALTGEEGYPYSVPVNFAYADGKIYFHGANEGYKLDCVRKNEKVSFSVVAKDEIIPEEFNSLFASVIIFGKARVLENDAEKQKALEAIVTKYSAEFMEGGKKYIKVEWDNAVAIEIEIEHMTAKKGV